MPNRNLSSNPKQVGNAKLYFAQLLIVAAVCAMLCFIHGRTTVRAQNRNRAAHKLMSESNHETIQFHRALEKVLAGRKQKISDLCRPHDRLEQRILNDYGAMFVADKRVLTPPVCMFADSKSVEAFQDSLDISGEEIGAVKIELQKAAMRALRAARREARAINLDITPRDGAEAARRSFDDTLRLWESRFFPALAFWTANGKIAETEADRLKTLPLREQIIAVLELEERRIFFSKDFQRSILSSVAAPGCSQHLSLIAFDANEFADERVRRILSNHGWFRTVNHDLPHFTFLGRLESALPALGLKRLETKYGEIWIPNVETDQTDDFAAR